MIINFRIYFRMQIQSPVTSTSFNSTRDRTLILVSNSMLKERLLHQSIQRVRSNVRSAHWNFELTLVLIQSVDCPRKKVFYHYGVFPSPAQELLQHQPPLKSYYSVMVGGFIYIICLNTFGVLGLSGFLSAVEKSPERRRIDWDGRVDILNFLKGYWLQPGIARAWVLVARGF